MEFRTITVCLEHTDQIAPMINMAKSVAADKSAVVKAVHVEPPSQIHKTVAPFMTSDLLSHLALEQTKRVAALKSSFVDATKGISANAQFLCPVGDYTGDLQPYLHHVLASDLTICAQPYTELEGVKLYRELLIESGTPMIMVPLATSGLYPHGHVGIAWNGTTESSRAVRDAMPLLKLARKVSIICIGNPKEMLKPSGDDVASWMEAHHVSANVIWIEENPHEAAHRLVSFANDTKLDMLVMGAFGHSRLYDAVFGAATVELIESASIPIFFAH